MKKIMQFRYYGKNHKENYPALENYRDVLVTGNIFRDFGPVSHLGIQASPGMNFYLNGNQHPIMVGETGIYELELENIGRIHSIQFNAGDLDKKSSEDPLLIDIIYEGA